MYKPLVKSILFAAFLMISVFALPIYYPAPGLSWIFCLTSKDIDMIDKVVSVIWFLLSIWTSYEINLWFLRMLKLKGRTSILSHLAKAIVTLAIICFVQIFPIVYHSLWISIGYRIKIDMWQFPPWILFALLAVASIAIGLYISVRARNRKAAE